MSLEEIVIVPDTNLLVKAIITGKSPQVDILEAIMSDILKSIYTTDTKREYWRVFGRETLEHGAKVTKNHRRVLQQVIFKSHIFDTGLSKPIKVSQLGISDSDDFKFVRAAAAYADLYQTTCFLVTNDYDLTGARNSLQNLGVIALTAEQFTEQQLLNSVHQ